MTIDIGSPAINRDGGSGGGHTKVDKNNPANLSGRITKIEIWAETDLTGVEVATFFVVSGDNLSTRDTYAIGNVTAGSKQTFDVDLVVQAGDYLGFYWASGNLDYYASGGIGRWTIEGNYIPCTNQLFTYDANPIYSVYGTGILIKSIAGEFDFSGSLVKKTMLSFAGAFTLTGTVNRLIKKGLSGVFGANGILSSIKRHKKALSGVLTFTKASLTAMIPHNYQKIIKAIADYTKTNKDTSTYTKTDKDSSDYTKRDK